MKNILFIALSFLAAGCKHDAYMEYSPKTQGITEEQIEKLMAALGPVHYNNHEENNAYYTGYRYGLELGPDAIGALIISPENYSKTEVDAWRTGLQEGAQKSLEIMRQTREGGLLDVFEDQAEGPSDRVKPEWR